MLAMVCLLSGCHGDDDVNENNSLLLSVPLGGHVISKTKDLLSFSFSDWLGPSVATFTTVTAKHHNQYGYDRARFIRLDNNSIGSQTICSDK